MADLHHVVFAEFTNILVNFSNSPHGPPPPNCWRFFEDDSGCVARGKARGGDRNG